MFHHFRLELMKMQKNNNWPGLDGHVYQKSVRVRNWGLGDSDVGDIVMLVTLWWWLILDVGGRIIMLVTFFVMLVIFSMY